MRFSRIRVVTCGTVLYASGFPRNRVCRPKTATIGIVPRSMLILLLKSQYGFPRAEITIFAFDVHRSRTDPVIKHIIPNIRSVYIMRIYYYFVRTHPVKPE